ncbi:hypothetical protein DAMA08_048950 [Martiniozyma asiatica (nom. inval.)]|nr:hypothetical protein DAMA08_048950 [Martiniozyma asiatica]
MVAALTELQPRFKAILRERCKLNGVKLASKMDLLLNLNYIRFMTAVILRANELATEDGTSEVMESHLQQAGDWVLQSFKWEDLEENNEEPGEEFN